MPKHSANGDSLGEPLGEESGLQSIEPNHEIEARRDVGEITQEQPNEELQQLALRRAES